MGSIFPSINSFAKMVGYQHYLGNDGKKFSMVLYPKLHGTNASIKIYPDASVEYRSKNRVLSFGADNAAFMAETAPNEALICAHFWDETQEVTIYGEWIGSGIHKSEDAACNLPSRTLCVFAVQRGDRISTDMVTEARRLRECGFTPMRPAGFITLDTTYGADLTKQVDIINSAVDIIAERDWFIAEEFGVIGAGEGVVGTVFGEGIDDQLYWDLAFKAKSEAHRVKKTKSAATAQEPMPHDIMNFVDMMVTEQRIRQAVDEQELQWDMRNTPHILKWVANDVLKEGQEEMASLDIEWKKIAKMVNGRIVTKWKELVNAEETAYIAGAAAALDS